jgi:hypothetical protein
MLGKRSVLILVVVLLLVGVGSYVVISHQPKMEKVVVTQQIITPNSVLMLNAPAGTPPSAFSVKAEPISQVPRGAYLFTTENALICHLNLLVVTQLIPRGYVLLQNDAHIAYLPTIAGLGEAEADEYTSPYASCPPPNLA